MSQAVQKALRSTLDIPAALIDVVYESIPTSINSISAEQIAVIKEQLGIPQNSLVVGGSGTTDWRKGPDLFVQLARFIATNNCPKPVHFVWVGGDDKSAQYGALMHDANKTGGGDLIHFAGHVDNPIDFYAAFDVFAMTSREDPFPLVNLETAALGIPIVCFDQSGGSCEFVKNECGFTVPYLDVPEMAARICELLSNELLRQQKGDMARKRVRDFDISEAGPKLLQLIRKTIDLSPDEGGVK